jgi:hypothetical protein
MFTLLIIFLSICLVGAGFWFFNRKQINGLVENIDDKQAIINALQIHVEAATQPQSTQKTVVSVRPEKKGTNGGNKNKKKKINNLIQFDSGSDVVFDFKQEKKNRPKPSIKPKKQQ